ncbi:MAG: acetyl-CoA carboxylase biotin carboxylase subunit [Bacteroidetes bacterium]|nr:acetyl-CoA carboxylase biotin carboxylase subunit [Bacteroidota bacterium]
MPHRPIKRILIANRGEIAVRIIRACRELGITAVAVYSDVDRSALHVRRANQAVALGGATSGESYLNKTKLLEAARKARVDAVHPGYGFLSENADFAEAVEHAGFKFIGPPPSAIRTLGDKTEARKRARELGVPTVPGTVEPLVDAGQAFDVAGAVGYPVLLKAAAGGGGRGMRIVNSEDEMPSAFATAHSEALNAFGDGRLYLEKLIENPRHVEVQVLADSHGSVLHLGERECSVQRRHQKVVEESPSPIIDEAMRAQMGDAAVTLARSAGYVNAGTVEFIVDAKKNFYFLEVNTRLQVEHPVTELVTGIDLVAEQIRIAGGGRLEQRQAEIRQRGHAIECRVYAEDPANRFLPSTGTLERYVLPEGPRVRVDNGYRQGDMVNLYYDPLLAKVVTWGRTRKESIAAMKRSLAEFHIGGVRSTIPFCQFVLSHGRFLKGDYDTGFVAMYFAPEALYREGNRAQVAAAIMAARAKARMTGVAPGDDATFTTQRSREWKKNRHATLR